MIYLCLDLCVNGVQTKAPASATAKFLGCDQQISYSKLVLFCDKKIKLIFLRSLINKMKYLSFSPKLPFHVGTSDLEEVSFPSVNWGRRYRCANGGILQGFYSRGKKIPFGKIYFNWQDEDMKNLCCIIKCYFFNTKGSYFRRCYITKTQIYFIWHLTDSALLSHPKFKLKHWSQGCCWNWHFIWKKKYPCLKMDHSCTLVTFAYDVHGVWLDVPRKDE